MHIKTSKEVDNLVIGFIKGRVNKNRANQKALHEARKIISENDVKPSINDDIIADFARLEAMQRACDDAVAVWESRIDEYAKEFAIHSTCAAVVSCVLGNPLPLAFLLFK